ncbi:MAG: transposase [Kiritimatiellia bacterium]
MSGEGRVAPKGLYWHKSLRNPNINYQSGWWSVSIQVAKNKSILGAIVGEKVVLNTLGRAVDDYWRTLPKKYPELEILDYVVMPNHFHALLRIHYMPSNREHHLGFLMSRFKGGTSFIYGKMRRTGGVEDIGEKLWQRDYWDDLVSSEEEFKGWQKYIRENPANWSSDRYGACTAYALGDTELLNRPRIAFVASQGFVASELRPRKIWPQKAAKAACSDRAAEVGRLSAACSDRAAEVGRLSAACSDRAAKVGRLSAACSDRAAEEGAPKVAPLSGGAASAAPVLISTFTSAQEREALRRALAKRRPLVAVFSAGIPEESALEPRLAAAICEGWALAISPQAPGSRLNKKIATWCNEFLLKNADEIWVGHLSPNGMLTQMLAGLGRGSGT